MKNIQKLIASLALLASVAVVIPSAASASGGSCPQWHDLAIQEGWSEADYARISPIMWRESHCIPTAYNRHSHDAGLLQLHRNWWSFFGVSSQELMNPATNLHYGHEVLMIQGWSAWSAGHSKRKHH